MSLKLALIQMNSGDDMAANIAALETFVAKAAGQGAQFVATPENTFLMKNSHPHPPASAGPSLSLIEGEGRGEGGYTQDEHPGVKAAAKLAEQYKVWLLIGSVADKIDDSGKTANRSLLFNPHGDVVASYDKIHLFDVEVGDGQTYKESSKIIPGGQTVVAPTPFGKIGMSVCYDVRFPHLYRQLAKNGAQILCVPSAFTQVTGEAHWHVLLRARAIENGCFVVAAAQCGTHPGNRKTYGHSLVVGPWGDVIADGGTEPGVVMAEINLEDVAKVRARIPSLQHDRKFT